MSPRPAAIVVGALLGLMVSTAPAFGQDAGPIIIQDRAELETFRLLHWSAAFGLEWRSQVDEIHTGGLDFVDRDTRLESTIELEAGGYFGHRNLVSFDLAGEFGLEERDIDDESDGLRDVFTDTLLNFDASLDCLSESALPFTLYARRDQTQVNRQFGPSVDSQSSEYGIILNHRSEETTLRVQMYHRAQDQHIDLVGNAVSISQNTLDVFGQHIFSPTHTLTVDYTFDDVAQGGVQQAENAFKRHDLLLTDEVRFGEDEKSSLRSNLHFRDESGRFALQSIRLTERLRLWHSQRFETQYDYNFSQQKRPGGSQQQHRISARFRHLLFDSLITHGDIGASTLHLPDEPFRTDEFFGGLDLTYTKIVPYGVLRATLDGRLNWQDNSDRGSDLLVADQSRTFDAAGLIVLERQNIVASSIVVTDVTGIIIYTEGFDYVVDAFPDRVEIHRILGGTIAPGQTVLIDYVVGPEPQNTVLTRSIGSTVRYTFNEGVLRGLSPYLRYSRRSQDRDVMGGVPFPVNNVTDFVMGVDYDIWRISLKAEHHIRDSSLSPFDMTRLEAYYTQTLGRRSSLVLSAIYRDTRRTRDDLRTTLRQFSARWNQQINQELQARLWLIYRDDSDSDSVDSQAFEQQLELNWQYRQTSVYAGVRNAFVRGGTGESTFQTFLLGFRRQF